MNKTKYDFGYELIDGTTNKWAFELIEEKSEILELGAAIGTLTRNLSEKKKCNIDIIEIDEESGGMASEYARNSCVGPQYGNLNDNLWKDVIGDNKYDYIVGLDVFEHLDNPKDLFKQLKTYLKPNGKIITSIPNISNNSIIINLMNDVFQYTDLGLLDKTHKVFFTYKSILEMFKDVGLNVESMDVIEKDIGESEIVVDTKSIPENVLEYLKNRATGNNYQYLIVASNDENIIDSEINIYREKKNNNTLLIMFNGEYKNTIRIPYEGENIEFEYDINEEYLGMNRMIICPVEHKCLISDFSVEICKNGRWEKLNKISTNGTVVSNTSFLFLDEKVNIDVWGIKGSTRIRLKCKCQKVYDDYANSLHKIAEEIKVNNRRFHEKNLMIIILQEIKYRFIQRIKK